MSSDPGPLAPLRNEPAETNCPTCHWVLSVRDTWTHDIYTLAGKRTVTEVTLQCRLHRRRIFPPPPLTPSKSPFAFDVIAEAGRLRFLEQRQFAEIATALHERGLPRLASRTVQRLTDRFALYHMAVHLESLPILRKELDRRGGYVLVLDGTGIPGRMTLVLTDDDESGGTGWVLLAAPIAEESADQIRPFLRRLRKALGPPLSGISDQGSGLRDAFRAVFVGVYLLLCHFHVLRGFGNTLQGKRYAAFRHELDRSGVKGRLKRLARRLRKARGASREARGTVAWIEEILGTEQAAKGRVYPFYLSALEFYRVSVKVEAELKAVLSRPGRRAKGRPYRKLEEILTRLSLDSKSRARLARDFPLLWQKWLWFERIRKVLGYRNGPVPLSPEGKLSARGLERGRRRLDWLLKKLRQEAGEKSRSPLVREFHGQLSKIAEKLETHREELFAPNVVVRVNGKSVVRALHRSNGAAERKFHGLRHSCRRITGDDGREGQVQREGPGMLIVSNLRDSRYARVVYGSLSHVGERFAHVNPAALAEAKLILTRKDELTSGRKALGQQ